MPLTDEQIKALLEGCEGVTPGPWFQWNDCKDAVHIARCDPDTIRELCTRVLEAEARLSQIADLDSFGTALVSKERDAALARIKVLEDALRWYASSEAWTFAEVQGPDGDYGKRARKALEEGK